MPGHDELVTLCVKPSALLSRGFKDKLRDFVGMRDQREMTGLHLDGPGSHPLGHEALKVRIDRAIFRRNRVVAWFRPPCRLRRLAGEQSFVKRLLHGIEHLRLLLRQVAREITQKASSE